MRQPPISPPRPAQNSSHTANAPANNGNWKPNSQSSRKNIERSKSVALKGRCLSRAVRLETRGKRASRVFLDILKGAGFALAVIFAAALWLVPNPIGKMVELWRFFRGD